MWWNVLNLTKKPFLKNFWCLVIWSNFGKWVRPRIFQYLLYTDIPKAMDRCFIFCRIPSNPVNCSSSIWHWFHKWSKALWRYVWHYVMLIIVHSSLTTGFWEQKHLCTMSPECAIELMSCEHYEFIPWWLQNGYFIRSLQNVLKTSSGQLGPNGIVNYPVRKSKFVGVHGVHEWLQMFMK